MLRPALWQLSTWALIGSALLVAGGGAIAWSADREARVNRGTEQSVCPCCSDDPDSVCCKGCSVGSLSLHATIRSPPLATQLESIAHVSTFATAGVRALDNFARILADVPPPQPAVDSPLHSCRYVGQIGTSHNPEQAAARAYFAVPEVLACNKAVPALRSRGEVNLLSSAGALSAADRNIVSDYVQACLSPSASVYAPQLQDSDIAAIRGRLTFQISLDESRIECEGFRLNNYVVTAAHCLGHMNEGDFVKVRGVDSPQTSVATVALIGTKDSYQHPELDYGLLKLQVKFDGDSEADLTWLSSPEPMGRLFLIQANSFTLMLKAIPTNSPFTDAINIQDNPACRAITAPPSPFILNGCQSEGGTSGSPYFQRAADGALRLVGVHAGLTSEFDGADLSDCAWSLPNYGVVLPIAKLVAKMR